MGVVEREELIRQVAVGLLGVLLLSCVVELDNPPGLEPRHGHVGFSHEGLLMVFGGSLGLQEYTSHRYPQLVRGFVSSPRGDAWTDIMPLGAFYGVGLRGFSRDGTIFVHGGGYSTPMDTELQFENRIRTSTDGSNWPIGGFFTGPGRKDHGFVWFDGSYWILGGNLGQEDLNLPYGPNNLRLANDVWKSTDGFAWTQVLANAEAPNRWSPREGHAVVVFEGKIWLIGGRRRVEQPSTSVLDYVTLGDV